MRDAGFGGDHMMTELRIAGRDDYERVRDFYYELTDALADARFTPGWEKDVYPTQEFLIRSIENQELYIGETDGRMVACMVVNHAYNDGYREVSWSVEAEDTELLVIHALGVHPSFSGRGIAKQMVLQVIEMARRDRMKTIRLDVLDGNLPAESAYTKVGFQYLDTIRMFYEDTGWTDYKLFEYVV